MDATAIRIHKHSALNCAASVIAVPPDAGLAFGERPRRLPND